MYAVGEEISLTTATRSIRQLMSPSKGLGIANNEILKHNTLQAKENVRLPLTHSRPPIYSRIDHGHQRERRLQTNEIRL